MVVKTFYMYVYFVFCILYIVNCSVLFNISLRETNIKSVTWVLYIAYIMCVFTWGPVLFNILLQEPVVQMMANVLPSGKLKVSSNDGMVNSLTDGSTETYWESRDEPRGKPRSMTASFDKKMKIFGASVHIDNTKDNGVSV